MGRAHRVDIEGGWYHVMNRGVNKQTVFFCDADRVEFGRLLGVIHERFGVRVVAYCLMSNHYHLVVHCPDGGLSEAMHVLGSVLTRHINDRAGRDGPLFRGRFHSVVIRSDDQLVVSVRYVHRNPLDIVGVESASDYRWSSHRTYLGHRDTPHFMYPEIVLDRFGGDAIAFDTFVDDERRIPSAARAVPPMCQLTSVVHLVLDELLPTECATSRVSRTVAIAMIDLLAPIPRQELIDSLAFASPKSLQQAQRRATERVTESPVLTEVVRRVLDLIV